jgi:hypothetical protein
VVFVGLPIELLRLRDELLRFVDEPLRLGLMSLVYLDGPISNPLISTRFPKLLGVDRP